MPYFSTDQVDAAIEYLVNSTHSTLTSLLAMWRAQAPVKGDGAPISFGSRQENSLLDDFFAPDGAPESHPFYIPFHQNQGKSRWRDRNYAGSSLQRQRTGLREIFLQDGADRTKWSLASGYVQELLAAPQKALGKPPIALSALAAFMLRDRDLPSMAAAVEMIVEELHLDRDGLIGNNAATSLFTKDDTPRIGNPSEPSKLSTKDLLEVLAKHSPAPAMAGAPTVAGNEPASSPVVDTEMIDASWEFDPALLEDLGSLKGLHGPAFSAAAALRRGKHVIFVGPPGTGKTSLAERLCQAAEIPFATVTATDQWTTFETIGGYFQLPTDDSSTAERLDFLPGLMVESIAAGRCLIVDELNRADMDKAFGELFTLLTGQSVTLPFRMRTAKGFNRIRLMTKPGLVESDVHGIGVPPWWRLIGAMNDADKGGIRRLSQAFKRRFSMVIVPLPSPDVYRDVLTAAAEGAGAPLEAPMEQFRDILIDLFATPGAGFGSVGHPMGPAIPLSMIAGAASEWALDPQRPVSAVLNSVLETDVASLLSTASTKTGDILGMVSAHVQDVSRFEAAVATWSGR